MVPTEGIVQFAVKPLVEILVAVFAVVRLIAKLCTVVTVLLVVPVTVQVLLPHVPVKTFELGESNV